MTGSYGRSRRRFHKCCRCRKRIRTKVSKRKTSKKNLLNQKLEQENYLKGLILDPQRNHLHQQNQNHFPTSRNGQVEEDQEQQQSSNHHYLQQELFYGRLDSQTAPEPPPPKKRSYFPSSSSEYAQQQNQMGDKHHHHQQTQQQTTVSRLGIRNSGGEIVEVQGGHIVRSTSRKDRHSKVCTAKGPRDRRVRLSAHTAIQFYDVQDRLGYDRPSKAVDWLMKKAKPAIDELAELPPWNPITVSSGNSTFDESQFQKQPEYQPQQQQRRQFSIHHGDVVDTNTSSNQRDESNSSFLPPSLDSDVIADTIKSFFPVVAATESNSSAIPFHNFPPQDCNLLSRTSSQSQDLRLSLQSFQDSILFQHSTSQNEQQALFSGNTPLGFDGAGWSENQPADIGRFGRMMAWNAGENNHATGGGGFVFNSPPTPPMLQPLFGQTQLFSQRGPLQSSNTPSVRAWMDPSAISDNHQYQYQQQTVLPVHPISGIGFASEGGGFSRFRIPARIQGDEEEHDGISDKPSSASSDSCH